MSRRAKVSLPVIGGFVPSRKWRVLRRCSQALTLLVILIAPLLGGWQRVDRNYLANWDGRGWDLPASLLAWLPMGDAPSKAYEANRLLGGGIAVDYLSVPVMDPVAGIFALAAGPWTFTVVIAWVLPVLLGLLAGRVFCGWLCPFGTVARALEWLLSRSPWRPPRFAVPEKRPVRWLILGGCIVAGLVGAPGLLYMLLPHALLQQGIYSLWLMGGASATLGWFLGLLLAGVVLGPTTYCATLCPTGAALSLNRRRPLLVVTLAEPKDCGTHCHLCTSACWLSLDPASGQPGPDCDGCARCFSVCPRTNMVMGLRRGAAPPAAKSGKAAAAAALLAAAVFAAFALAGGSAAAQTADVRTKPRLLFEGQQLVGDVTASLSVVDVHEVRQDADDLHQDGVVRLSLIFSRGAPGAKDEVGRQELRETYAGPLQLRVLSSSGEVVAEHDFEGANAPYSTPNRRLYRVAFAVHLDHGERVVVGPLEGWSDQGLTWQIPAQGRLLRWQAAGRGFAAGALVFLGLLSLALAVGRRSEAAPA